MCAIFLVANIRQNMINKRFCYVQVRASFDSIPATVITNVSKLIYSTILLLFHSSSASPWLSA